jgi:hypothetical protein
MSIILYCLMSTAVNTRECDDGQAPYALRAALG